MAAKPLPDQAYLCQCFSYNPRLGRLTWRKRPREHFVDRRAWLIWNTRFSGKIAGVPGVTGSLYIHVGNIRYQAHRLIWKMVTGIDPVAEIDHRDHDPGNNKWANIRSATRLENLQNASLRYNNRCRLKGVKRDRRSGKFLASISVSGLQKHLGTFETANEAHEAYCDAARLHFGEFWTAG